MNISERSVLFVVGIDILVRAWLARDKPEMDEVMPVILTQLPSTEREQRLRQTGNKRGFY